MRERVASLAPLPTLPRNLIPDLNETWRPPILYYGWPMGDLLPRLLEYAEKNMLVQCTVIGTVHRPVAPTGEKLYDQWYHLRF